MNVSNAFASYAESAKSVKGLCSLIRFSDYVVAGRAALIIDVVANFMSLANVKY